MIRQHPTQLVQAGFARAVTERLKGRHADTVDGADVDHARRVAGRGSGLEEGRDELRDGEDAGQVQREDPRPSRVRELVVRRAPVGAGVVDQDVEFGFVLPELVDHPLAVFEFVEIGGDGVGAALACRDRGGVSEGFGGGNEGWERKGGPYLRRSIP